MMEPSFRTDRTPCGTRRASRSAGRIPPRWPAPGWEWPAPAPWQHPTRPWRSPALWRTVSTAPGAPRAAIYAQSCSARKRRQKPKLTSRQLQGKLINFAMKTLYHSLNWWKRHLNEVYVCLWWKRSQRLWTEMCERCITALLSHLSVGGGWVRREEDKERERERAHVSCIFRKMQRHRLIKMWPNIKKWLRNERWTVYSW